MFEAMGLDLTLRAFAFFNAACRLHKICIAYIFPERLEPILGMFWTAARQ